MLSKHSSQIGPYAHISTHTRMCTLYTLMNFVEKQTFGECCVQVVIFFQSSANYYTHTLFGVAIASICIRCGMLTNFTTSCDFKLHFNFWLQFKHLLPTTCQRQPGLRLTPTRRMTCTVSVFCLRRPTNDMQHSQIPLFCIQFFACEFYSSIVWIRKLKFL